MARLGKQCANCYENFYTESRMLQSYRRLYFDLLAAKSPKAASIDPRNYGGILRRRQEELGQTYSKLVSSTNQLKGDGL